MHNSICQSLVVLVLRILQQDADTLLLDQVEQVMATCAPTLEGAVGTTMGINDQHPHIPTEVFDLHPLIGTDRVRDIIPLAPIARREGWATNLCICANHLPLVQL